MKTTENERCHEMRFDIRKCILRQLRAASGPRRRSLHRSPDIHAGFGEANEWGTKGSESVPWTARALTLALSGESSLSMCNDNDGWFASDSQISFVNFTKYG